MPAASDPTSRKTLSPGSRDRRRHSSTMARPNSPQMTYSLTFLNGVSPSAVRAEGKTSHQKIARSARASTATKTRATSRTGRRRPSTKGAATKVSAVMVRAAIHSCVGGSSELSIRSRPGKSSIWTRCSTPAAASPKPTKTGKSSSRKLRNVHAMIRMANATMAKITSDRVWKRMYDCRLVRVMRMSRAAVTASRVTRLACRGTGVSNRSAMREPTVAEVGTPEAGDGLRGRRHSRPDRSPAALPGVAPFG